MVSLWIMKNVLLYHSDRSCICLILLRVLNVCCLLDSISGEFWQHVGKHVPRELPRKASQGDPLGPG